MRKLEVAKIIEDELKRIAYLRDVPVDSQMIKEYVNEILAHIKYDMSLDEDLMVAVFKN